MAANPTDNFSMWMTLQQVADYSGYSTSLIYKESERGHLKAYRRATGRLLRFARADVDAWIKGEPVQDREAS